MSQDAPRRVSLAAARAARTGRPEVAAAYDQARLRFELAEAVRARREELGWSQRRKRIPDSAEPARNIVVE